MREKDLSVPAEGEPSERIRQRAEKATPGPWQNGVRGSGSTGDAHMCCIVTKPEDNGHGVKVGMQIGATWHPEIGVSYVGLSRQQNVDNAEFVAHARTDIPYLLDRLEAAEARADAAERLTGELVAGLKDLRAMVIGEHGASAYENVNGERADAAIAHAEARLPSGKE